MNLINVFGTRDVYKVDLDTCEFFKYEVSKYSNKKPVDGFIKLNTSIVRGYVKVCIGCKRVSVHRLILQSIHDIENKDLQVNHIDGNKQNNHYSNLEWCTSKENCQHAVKSGLRVVRQSCVRKDRGLSDDVVIGIKEMIRDGFSSSEIRSKYNIKPNTFHYIKNGRNYHHIQI